MPLNIPADHYQATFYHDTAGTLRLSVCTLGVHYVGADFINEANDLRLAWGTTVMPVLNNQVQYNRFTLASAEGVVNDFAMAVVGSETDTMAPPNVAYLIKKLTSQPGRHNRGRMYLPGVNEVDLNAVGTIGTPALTPLVAAMNAFYDACQAANFQPVLLHNSIIAPTNIVAFGVDPRVATQRRRLRG